MPRPHQVVVGDSVKLRSKVDAGQIFLLPKAGDH